MGEQPPKFPPDEHPSDKLKESFQNKYFELLMTEAANTKIDNSPTLPIGSWVNPYLIREGQAFFRRNFDSVLFSHFVGLTIVFSYKPIASVLLRTGGTHVKYNSRMRYLSTILHLRKWYESDLLRKSAKDVHRVRKLHAKVLDLLLSPEDCSCMIDEQDLLLSEKQENLLKILVSDAVTSNVEGELPDDFNSYDPEVLMSQLDMVLVQYAFMGFIAQSPETFGIHDRMGLTGFIHFWAVIGHLLGIEDRYNLGLHQDKQSLDLISRFIFIPCFKRIDEGVLTLWEGMFDGVGKFFPFLKEMKPILYFIFKDVLKIPSRRLYASMTRYEMFCYYRQAWNLNHFKRNSLMKHFDNFLVRVDIHFATKKFMRNSQNIF